VRKIGVLLVSLTLLVAAPGVALADAPTRTLVNQKAVNDVIARGLSQVGVPFTYGGGDVSGPTRGRPEPPSPEAVNPGDPGDPASALSPGLTTPGALPSPAPAVAPDSGTTPASDVVGFDASGLMVYSYAAINVKLPRSSGAQYKVGQKVAPSQALPADLIFYGPDGSQSVALFIGNGQMLEVGSDGVKASPVRTKDMAPYLVRIIQ